MKNNDCIFCSIIAKDLPGIEIFRDDICIVLMDIFPISRGHLMVIPLVHCGFSHELSGSVRSHIFEKASMLSDVICRSDLKAKGAHILINDGKAANQHIPHVHMHIIPRYNYDLIFILLSLLTRFINPLAIIGRQKRLKKQAVIIQRALSDL
jgi:diadenosine tetraphosphate (Ap4A) HIT family hydrolase